jgi:phosphohistidine phosphatase
VVHWTHCMKLYFLRHADALPGNDDAKRPLSDRGIKESKKLGKFLKRIGIQFDAAYCSPLVRAVETADWVLGMTNRETNVKLKLSDSLLNATTPKEFHQWLQSLPDDEHALLVGHAPSLSEHVGRMLETASVEGVKLPKAGLACLETEDRLTGVLKLFVSPKELEL